MLLPSGSFPIGITSVETWGIAPSWWSQLSICRATGLQQRAVFEGAPGGRTVGSVATAVATLAAQVTRVGGRSAFCYAQGFRISIPCDAAHVTDSVGASHSGN